MPIDVLECGACRTPLLEEDWMAPVMPYVPGRCINCGERREYDTCPNCGLNRDEDAQVHDELRFMVSPDHSLFDAARIANKAGRHLMALKLATAATALDKDGNADRAHALRIWILSAIGENQAAVEDARLWSEGSQDPPIIALISYGQQLEANAFPGAAADVYRKVLRKDPSLHQFRARRAGLLLQLSREGQAIDESCRVLENADDPEAVEIAIQVAEALCDSFEGQYRDDEIDRMLERAGAFVEQSPKLLAHRARLSAVNGDPSGAKRDLKKARKLNAELDIYERVERAIKPARSSWWRW